MLLYYYYFLLFKTITTSPLSLVFSFLSGWSIVRATSTPREQLTRLVLEQEAEDDKQHIKKEE